MRDLSKKNLQLPPEQQAIRDKCFHPLGTFVEFTKEEIEQSIAERFEKTVDRYPDRLAIKDHQQTLTYEQLDKAANRIAHTILSRQGEGNHTVAIVMEHGASVLAAILGALKAGKIYVPLDPRYPLSRLKFMRADAQATLIVADKKNCAVSSAIAGDDCQVMESETKHSKIPSNRVGLRISPDALACIFYTSGSTGQPKGVFDNQRNVLHGTLRFTNGLHLSPDDRLSFTNSCSSSASLRRIFPALLNGASLFPFDVRQDGIDGLVNLVLEEGITYVSLGRIRELVRPLRATGNFNNVRLASFGGEVTHKRDLEICRKLFPSHCLIGVWLSSTETGNVTQLLIDQQTQIADDVVPIGYPTWDMQVTLRDDAGIPLAQGEIGEIAVQSAYLSLGYWRRPELTRAKFLADPDGGPERIYLTGDLGRMDADGCLHYVGRKDDQVKVRGYRVELAEIEAALLRHGDFKKVFVTLRERGSGEPALIAYLVPETLPAPTASALRSALSEKLPDHMIPSAFVMLETMPLTPTQKIDRTALPEPGTKRPSLDTPFVAPGTSVERELAAIWREVLALDDIGIHDNFFDLGGHSLAATRVISQVLKRFQLEIPLRSLLESPTVAQMAQVIVAYQEKRIGNEELERVLAELEAITEEEAQKLLAEKQASGEKL
jgi:amino acid adenylation domain-containing protein